MKQVSIGTRAVGDDCPPYIIAEACINHDGKIAVEIEPRSSLAPPPADSRTPRSLPNGAFAKRPCTLCRARPSGLSAVVGSGQATPFTRGRRLTAATFRS